MRNLIQKVAFGVLLLPFLAAAQIDPVQRQLFQLGYNAAMEGHSPFSGYAFYYLNKPGFIETNLTLRLALAPVYLDSEIGISHIFGDNTDLGIGLAGGGFAASYSEIRQGTFLPSESFQGHEGGTSVSLYHLFNPGAQIPLNGVLRAGAQYAFYEADDQTAPGFQIPESQPSFNIRSGLRWGGREPTLFPSLSMELSAWYEGQFRTHPENYGFSGDRRLEANSHLFWMQALLAYTLPEKKHNFFVNVTAGTSVNADRFSAYRLGALLPLATEFPLSLPGYYYQELTARQFVLLGGSYLLPIDANKQWNLNVTLASAFVDYLDGLEEAGHWHTGVGAGIVYRSPSDSLKIMLSYGYGVDAIRDGSRGAHSIGLLMQIDLEHVRSYFLNPESPGRWRGWQRMFGS